MNIADAFGYTGLGILALAFALVVVSLVYQTVQILFREESFFVGLVATSAVFGLVLIMIAGVVSYFT